MGYFFSIPSISLTTFKKFKIDDASDSSETIEAVINKLGMVTALDMVNTSHVNHIDLDLLQGHTGLNTENNKCSIISECSRNLHQVCFEDSLTKGLYILFSV